MTKGKYEFKKIVYLKHRKIIRHIKAPSTGWIDVKLEPSGKRVSLPEYLKVELTSNKNKRDYITILEGVYKDQIASVKESNLGSGATYTGPAQLTFNIQKKELTYNSHNTAYSITSNSKPIPKGNYPIQIPDFPHPIGSLYMPQSKYAKHWFYLGIGNAIYGTNDRYLHTG